jgi:glycosyltransferase involved in cell wall biosynthesis
VRLALVAPGFSHDDHDWCIPALAHLVRALSQRHQVEVFALRYPPRPGTTRAFGADVHALGGAGARGLRRVALLARARAAMLRAARRRFFDLVHGLWADEPGWLAVSVARSLGVPAVVSLLGGELVSLPDIGYCARLSTINRRLVRRTTAGATLVTVGSRFMERLAAPHGRADRLRLAPLGVDTSLFRPDAPSPPGLLDGSPGLLSVGSLTRVKDQGTLLRAFARISDDLPGCRLHLVGDGPMRPDLDALADRLGMADRVRFHGAVAHDRLPAYYRAADLCVVSSRFESQGMVFLEAAMCGRATVGTAVGLLPELAAPDLVVPVADEAALARALAALGRDPSRCAAAGEAARLTAMQSFSLTACVDRLLGLYEEAALLLRASR